MYISRYILLCFCHLLRSKKWMFYLLPLSIWQRSPVWLSRSRKQLNHRSSAPSSRYNPAQNGHILSLNTVPKEPLSAQETIQHKISAHNSCSRLYKKNTNYKANQKVPNTYYYTPENNGNNPNAPDQYTGRRCSTFIPEIKKDAKVLIRCEPSQAHVSHDQLESVRGVDCDLVIDPNTSKSDDLHPYIEGQTTFWQGDCFWFSCGLIFALYLD